jgi:hypothetical protein
MLAWFRGEVVGGGIRVVSLLVGMVLLIACYWVALAFRLVVIMSVGNLGAVGVVAGMYFMVSHGVVVVGVGR